MNADWLGVHVLHLSSANIVLLQIFLYIIRAHSGIEMSLFSLKIFYFLRVIHLLLNLSHDLLLSLKSLSSELWQFLGWVLASTNDLCLSVEMAVGSLAVNAIIGVVKHLVSGDWDLCVTASLWNMLTHDGSIKQ